MKCLNIYTKRAYLFKRSWIEQNLTMTNLKVKYSLFAPHPNVHVNVYNVHSPVFKRLPILLLIKKFLDWNVLNGMQKNIVILEATIELNLTQHPNFCRVLQPWTQLVTCPPVFLDGHLLFETVKKMIFWTILHHFRPFWPFLDRHSCSKRQAISKS